MMNKKFLNLSGLVFILALSACSKINYMLDSKVSVNYQNNQAIKALEVPPDLTAPQYDRSFALPEGGTISAAAMQNGGLAPVTFISSGVPVANVPATRVAQTRTGKLASIRNQGGNTVLQIHDTYQRALILTDIMLERLNFSVLRRDMSRGIYHVQYNGADVGTKDESGFVSRMWKRSKSLFGRSATKTLANGQTYQVQIRNEGGVPILRFKNNNGQSLASVNQTKVITLLNNEFNR